MLRTKRQTDKQTVSNILPTPTNIVGVGKDERIAPECHATNTVQQLRNPESQRR